MSDKPAEKKDEKVEGDGKKKAGMMAMLTKLPVLLAIVMVLEAVVLFAGMKMLGGGAKTASAVELPKEGEAAAAEGEASHEGATAEKAAEGGHEAAPAKAEGGHDAAPAKEGEKGAEAPKKIDPKKPTEIKLIEFRAPNSTSGKRLLYDVSISIVTKGKNAEKVQSAVSERMALIQDRIRTIIAQSEPEKLGGGSEPGMETLKRQVKYQLEEIIGDGLIDEVLVPRCIPFRTDF